MTVRCETCCTPTVRALPSTPGAPATHRCTRCGEVRAWCPRCDQGWVRHLRAASDHLDVYVCDECDAAWETRDAVANRGYSDFSTRFPDRCSGAAYSDWTRIRDMRSDDGNTT